MNAWQRLGGLAAIWLAGPNTSADLIPVTALTLVEQTKYTIERPYGGQLHHRRASDLGFEVAGTIAAVAVDEGERVSKGQVLAELDDRALRAELKGGEANLAVTRATLQAQKAQQELAEASLRRYEELVATGHGSAQRLDELRSQLSVSRANVEVFAARMQSAVANLDLIRTKLAKCTLMAPYDGVLQTRKVDEGSIVSPGTPILRMVETGEMEAKIGLPQEMAARLLDREDYRFRVNRKEVTGRLVGVLPVADAGTGTVTALFHIKEAGSYAGTLTELILSVDVKSKGFWIPLSALAESQRGLWSVLVVTKDSVGNEIIEPHLVNIIHRGANSVFVDGTLVDGDTIVASGTNRIVPGQQVRIAKVSDKEQESS